MSTTITKKNIVVGTDAQIQSRAATDPIGTIYLSTTPETYPVTDVKTSTDGTTYSSVLDGTEAKIDLSPYLTSHQTMLYRPVEVNGTEILSDVSSSALNLVAGSNITLTNNNGAVTIASSGGGSSISINATTGEITGADNTGYALIPNRQQYSLTGCKPHLGAVYSSDFYTNGQQYQQGKYLEFLSNENGFENGNLAIKLGYAAQGNIYPNVDNTVNLGKTTNKIASVSTYLLNPNANSFGCQLPDTTAFTASKTLATTDQIPTVSYPVTDVTVGGSSVLSGTTAVIPAIPAAVSGTNDGTNWTSLTVGSDTYAIPAGGGGSATLYHHTVLFNLDVAYVIEITNTSSSAMNATDLDNWFKTHAYGSTSSGAVGSVIKPRMAFKRSSSTDGAPVLIYKAADNNQYYYGWPGNGGTNFTPTGTGYYAPTQVADSVTEE